MGNGDTDNGNGRVNRFYSFCCYFQNKGRFLHNIRLKFTILYNKAKKVKRKKSERFRLISDLQVKRPSATCIFYML